MLGLPWSIGNVASAHVVFFLMLFRKHCRTGGLLLLTLKNGAAAIVVTSATHRAFEKGKRSDAVVETASSAVSGNASFSLPVGRRRILMTAREVGVEYECRDGLACRPHG